MAAIKVKADLIIDKNMLPIYFDDEGTPSKTDNVLSDYDITDLMSVLDSKNASEFDIKLVSLDLTKNKVSIFSEIFISPTIKIKTWFTSDFTTEEQTTINNFINSL